MIKHHNDNKDPKKSKNTNRGACRTPYKVCNGRRRTSSYSHLSPIIFYSPKLSPTFQKDRQQINLDTNTVFLGCKRKRFPCQNIIEKRSFCDKSGKSISIYTSRSASSFDPYNSLPSRPRTLPGQIFSLNR